MDFKIFLALYFLNASVTIVVNTSKSVDSIEKNNNQQNWNYYNTFVQIKNLYGLENVKNFSKRSTNISHRQPRQRRLDVSSSIWSDVKQMYGTSDDDKPNVDKREPDRIIQDVKITQHHEYFSPKKKPIHYGHASIYHKNQIQRTNYDDFTYYKSSFNYPDTEKQSSFTDFEENIDKYKLRKNALKRYQPSNHQRIDARETLRREKIQNFINDDYYYDPISDDYFWGIDDYDDEEISDWEKGSKGTQFEVNTKYRGSNFRKRHNRLKFGPVIEENLIDRYIGPLISSHVVTTSIHPWIFPYFFGIAEPYISFITFVITALIELFGIGVGSAGLLVGLRAFRITDNDNDNGASTTGGSSNSAQVSAVVDACSSVTCSVTGETCSSGSCMCGTGSSCSGQTTGAYCDASNNICKCSATKSACSSTETCDAGNNACKCGTASSCSGNAQGEYCDSANNACKCSASVALCTSPETCTGGACKCGTASSCVGNAQGAYCDASNNVCKCTSSVAACTSPETCDSGNGVCKCGTASTCVGNAQGAYCDSSNNVCKCSASLAACTSPETCDSANGVCKCGTASSCAGNAQGAYCDSSNNACKCSASVALCTSPETCTGGACKCGTASSCVGNAQGAYCDASNNVCKCTASLAACTSPETCDSANGVCKCGSASSCAGNAQGSYCDSANNVCKCTASVAACTSPETCDSANGVCKCGTSSSCAGLSTGSYCDSANNVCKCSASVAACTGGLTCSSGSCVSVCNPTCSGLTDTCDAGTCKCGSSSACSTSIATRCLSGVCKCGQANQCTAGTTVPSCLYSQGQTPDQSIAFHVLFSTCKCSGTSCTTGSDASAYKPFCGTTASSTATIPVNVGVCGQCNIIAGGGGDPSSCTKSNTNCVQGTCDSGKVCCQSGECATSNTACLI